MGRGGGAQPLLNSFATTRLHGICNGSNNGMKDGGGGGGHTLQPNSLGTGDKCSHQPPIPDVCLGLGGGPFCHKISTFNILKPNGISRLDLSRNPFRLKDHFDFVGNKIYNFFPFLKGYSGNKQ